MHGPRTPQDEPFTDRTYHLWLREPGPMSEDCLALSITVFGQSGGGSKVAALLAMPQAQGLFHKTIIQSVSTLLDFATLDAERNTQHFLQTLGLDRGHPDALHELSAVTLLQAMPKAIATAGGINNYRPVVDGQRALELSQSLSGVAANALHLRGDVGCKGDSGSTEGEACYRQALCLAEPRGMRPLEARCHSALAALYRSSGRRQEAEQHGRVSAAIQRGLR